MAAGTVDVYRPAAVYRRLLRYARPHWRVFALSVLCMMLFSATDVIFVQMILMYFLNGLYKLLGPDWQDGSSLYYVLGDLTLTRFSQPAIALPIEVTRVLTWSVVAWEVTFPLCVLWKWPRRIALTFGVLFHLGIFATMELAGFVPYALCMYLPLVSWEGRVSKSGEGQVISADK